MALYMHDHALTLVADPARAPLNGKCIDKIFTSFAGEGIEAEWRCWLAAEEACDISIRSGQEAATREILEDLHHEMQIDYILQPPENRRKGLLVSDMEATIIAEEMLDEIAAEIGCEDEVTQLTCRAMAGEIDFETSFRNRIRLFAGQRPHTLLSLFHKMTLNAGARTLVGTMRHHGARTCLVTGGLNCYAHHVAALCGFHDVLANDPEIRDGMLTGECLSPLIGPAAKKEHLQKTLAQMKLLPENSCAIGDGANDVPMLQYAGIGAAFRGKPPANEAANMKIDYGNLTALLFAQGYRKSDFRPG